MSENNNLEMKCDYCEFAGLFDCTHPQYWIKSFRENCNLFRALPNGEMRVKVDYNVNCSYCHEKVHMDDAHIGAKGSRYICEKCYGK